MKKFYEWGMFSIFPKHCAYCDALIPGNEFACADCKKNLPRITGEICKRCGRNKSDCTCKGSSNYYKSIAAPFYFEDNVRKGIHKFKFSNLKGNSKAYAYEMSKTVNERFKGVKFDYITEVPMSKKSMNARGYNQSSLLCKRISELTDINYEPKILKKIYETDKQHGLNRILRKGNLTGVYDSDFPEKIEGKTILLCDDISTSGETLNECSKMLWLYGAKEIYCITAALTKMRGDKNVRNKYRN